MFLPQKSKGFITSTLIENEINEFFQGMHRLWVEVVPEPENLKFDYVLKKKETVK